MKKPTPRQINLIKNTKNHFLLVKKNSKTPKVPSSGLGELQHVEKSSPYWTDREQTLLENNMIR